MANRNVTKIIFSQKRDYEYDYAQTRILAEFSKVYSNMLKHKAVFNYRSMTLNDQQPVIVAAATQKYTELQNVIFNLLKKDPIGGYVELKRILRREKIELDKSLDDIYTAMLERYVQVLSYVIKSLEATKLIEMATAHISGMQLGDRSIYRRIFTPNIKPDFMFTKIMASYPRNGTETDSYNVRNSDVIIFKLQHNVQNLYHITPPEFKLPEEKYEILDLARKLWQSISLRGKNLSTLQECVKYLRISVAT